MEIDGFIQVLEVMLKPSNFVKNFETKEDFIEWANEGEVEDVQFALKAFEDDEMYEYCQILKEVIESKNGDS